MPNEPESLLEVFLRQTPPGAHGLVASPSFVRSTWRYRESLAAAKAAGIATKAHRLEFRDDEGRVLLFRDCRANDDYRFAGMHLQWLWLDDIRGTSEDLLVSRLWVYPPTGGLWLNGEQINPDAGGK